MLIHIEVGLVGQCSLLYHVPSLLVLVISTTWNYCKLFSCVRFNGELTVDKVTNWFATTVLALPQINYYSRESLVICLNLLKI